MGKGDFGSRMQPVPLDTAEGGQGSVTQQLLSIPHPLRNFHSVSAPGLTPQAHLVLSFPGLDGTGWGQSRDS